MTVVSVSDISRSDCSNRSDIWCDKMSNTINDPKLWPMMETWPLNVSFLKKKRLNKYFLIEKRKINLIVQKNNFNKFNAGFKTVLNM